MQCNLNAIEGRSIENKLPISLLKCSVLHYGARNAKTTYSFGNQLFANVNEYMDLGIASSDTFTYSNHIHTIVMRVSRLTGMVMKIFGTCDKKILLQIFCAYIRLKLKYASPVWSSQDAKSRVLLVYSRHAKFNV